MGLKLFVAGLLVSLLLLSAPPIVIGEAGHEHESEKALATVLSAISASNNASMSFGDLNTLAAAIVPNRSCGSACPACTTASYVFNALNLTAATGVIDGHEFANASIIIVYTITHTGWKRVCNSTINSKPGGIAYHLEEMLHHFGNETAKGMNEKGIVKLLKEVNEEYGPSHPNTNGRKCFTEETLVEEEGGAHTNHSHDHGKYHPATEISPKLLENLAQGHCINIATASTNKPEDHFAEILEAIKASSKVVMSKNDLKTLTSKIMPGRGCSNCIGCTIASFVYTSMGLSDTAYLNKTNFPTAAIVITYTLLPEGWLLVCNATVQAKPGSPDVYREKLLHEFGNETLMQYSSSGITKMLKEINDTYGKSHPHDGRTCFSATSLLAVSNTTSQGNDHSGHVHKRAVDDHDHGAAVTPANATWHNGSEVFVPLIEKLARGQCIKANPTSSGDDHGHGTTLPDKGFFVRNVFELYATNGRITLDGLKKLMLKLNITSNSTSSGHDDHSGHVHRRSVFKRAIHDHQFEGKCYSASQLFTIFSINASGADTNQFTSLSPALVQQIVTGPCNSTNTTQANTTVARTPTTAEVWGYSMLAVTIVTLTSVAAIVIIPCIGNDAIRYVVAGLIGLAVGSLCGDSILHLIPHAVTEHDHSAHGAAVVGLTGEQKNLMKMLVCLGGVYLFYIFEAILVIVSNKDEKKEEDGINMNSYENPGFSNNSDAEKAANGTTHFPQSQGPAVDGYVSLAGRRVVCLGLTAVGIIVVIGDGFHNFTDGIAIGASFKSSLSLGLSTSIAVFCHELPQELGDFAILYASGMSWKKALVFNLISALTCYIGAIIGIFAASTDEARKFLFALTGGLFLYISLVDLMPQLTGQSVHSHSHSPDVTESDQKKNILGGKMNWKKFACQNIGILFGFTIMFLLAYFEEKIKL